MHKLNRILKSSGFTIVELLIVIVVIAILATVSIVAYNGIQNRAHVSTVQSDFSNAAKKAEVYRVNSSNDSYPTNTASLIAADIQFSKGSYNALIWCAGIINSVPAWAVVADVKDGKTYVYSSATKSFSEFTSNKVQGNSGSTTCPATGMSNGLTWQWLLQFSAGAWTY